MKICKTYLLCTLFSLLSVSQTWAQSIVGAWSNNDTTAEGSSVLVFLANGYFFQIQNAKASEAPHGFDGFERGTYTWNPTTGAFTATVLQDLNGDTGFSNLNGLTGITLTVSGDTATANIPGSGAVTVSRVTGTSPIVGAWSFGNPAIADNSGVIVFLPNGVYFMARDGDSSALTGDPSGHDGIEHGTYSWNPTTGALTSSRTPAPYVDTNGKWGLSDPTGPQTFTVSADGLTLTVTEGTSSSSLARVSAASPLVPQLGLWWNPNESGSGYNVDVKHNVIVVTLFSYKTTGDSEWYLASGPLSADGRTFSGTLDKYRNGQCIACGYTGRPNYIGNDGTIGVTFTSPTSAILQLPGGRMTNIQPQAF